MSFMSLLSFILETAVQGDKVMKDFELESLATGGDHSQKVKATPVASNYDSKDCVNLSPSTVVSRFISCRQADLACPTNSIRLEK